MWFNAHFWTLCGQKILSEMNSVVRSSFPFQRYRTCECVYIKINARVNTAFCSGLILLQGSWKKDMFSSSLVPQHALLTLFLSILSEGQNNEVHNILQNRATAALCLFNMAVPVWDEVKKLCLPGWNTMTMLVQLHWEGAWICLDFGW